MQNIISISTSWNIQQFKKPKEVVHSLKEIGIQYVELNYSITKQMIDDILPYVEKGEIFISSLHNFCPRPPIEDDLLGRLTLSNTDDNLRQRAVDYTIDTIDMAARLGVNAVVVHTGDIPTVIEPEFKLRDIYLSVGKESEEFQKKREELVKLRIKEKGPSVKACEKSLFEISDYIARKGYNVKLGLENRYFYYDIPIYEEYVEWFKMFSDCPVGYWHDMGHGEVLENLSLADPLKLISHFKEKLLGIHIHDTDGFDDHYPPGCKKTDYTRYKELLSLPAIHVLELKSGFSIEQVKAGLVYLNKITKA